MKNGLEYIRRFLKSTGILSVGVILPKVVVFFLLSYNTAHIGTSEYGYYDLSVSYATMFSYLLFFDIWITTMRFLYERENPEDRDRIVRSGASIFFFSCIAYGAVACLIGFFLAPDYLAETVLYGLTQNLVSFYTFSARGFRRDLDFAVSGLIGSVIMGIADLLMVGSLQWGIRALYLSAVLGATVQCLYLEFRISVLHKALSVPTDRKLMNEMFRFTFPMGIGAAAFWVLNSLDKVLMGHLLDLNASGIYAVAERLASLITFAVQVFTYAWQDIAFRHESDDEGVFYTAASDLYFRFLCLGILMLMPAVKLVFPYLFTGDYTEASPVIPFAILAAALSGFSLFLGNIFYALHETRSSTMTSLISCIVNLAVCYPCIRTFGISGASIAISISFAFDSSLKSLSLRKKIGYRIPFKTLAISCAAVCAGMLIYFKASVPLNLLWASVCLAFFGLPLLKPFLSGRQ